MRAICFCAALSVLLGSCLSAGGAPETEDGVRGYPDRVSIFYLYEEGSASQSLAFSYFIASQSAFYSWIGFNHSEEGLLFRQGEEFTVVDSERITDFEYRSYRVKGFEVSIPELSAEGDLSGSLYTIRCTVDDLITGAKPVQPAYYAVLNAVERSGRDSGSVRLFSMALESSTTFIAEVIIR
jgi:hypothetical protein